MSEEPAVNAEPSSGTAEHTLPKAVVLDTNLWSDGILDVGRLIGHAERLAESGTEIWVPELVVLEWASHSFKHFREVELAMGKLYRTRLVSQRFRAPEDIGVVVQEIREKLAIIQNVKIIAARGESAIAGLMDQILGTGPGTTVSGVKTGSVDSAWVRDAIAQANGDPNAIVFVSKNRKDIQRTIKSMGFEHVEIRDESTFYLSLFELSDKPNRVLELIVNYLLKLRSDTMADDYHSPLSDPWIDVSDIELAPSLFHPAEPFEVTSIDHNADPIIVGISRLEILETNSSSIGVTATFHLLLLTELTATGYQLDNNGSVEMTSASITSALISAPFAVDIEDLLVKRLDNQGSARAFSSEVRFEDGRAAREDLTETLRSLSGLVIVDDQDLLQEGSLLRGPSGREILVEEAGIVYDEWELRFRLSTDEIVIIRCSYDVGSRVWAGKEGFDLEAPYFLYGEQHSNPYATISTIWQHLTQE